MSRVRLIITADDLGASEGRNAGILDAWRDGVVTGTTLLVNGDAMEDGARLVREHGIPCGVHLNLSEGMPLGGPIPGICDEEGRFLGKMGLRRALIEKDVDALAVKRELRLQIERAKELGIIPDHLDTHQHCGILLPLMALHLELAREEQIPVRRSSPVEPAAMDPGGFLGEEMRLYRHRAPQVDHFLQKKGVPAPDGLIGMPFLNAYDTDAMLRVLMQLKPGTWEWMCHPGRRDAHDPFDHPERERERSGLTDPRLRHAIEKAGIQRITYGALPCPAMP